jgi:citrate synthase
MAIRNPVRNELVRGEMISAEEAAERLGVKLSTLYAYVSRGWLKSYRRKVGRQALYRRADIDALRGVVTPERGRRGRALPEATSWVTVAQPINGEAASPGVIVAESAVSSIVNGRLFYRGYPVEELAASANFEEVCLLLWNGERADGPEVRSLRAEIYGARMPSASASSLAAVGQDAAPLVRLIAIMPSLIALERNHAPRARIRQAMLIVSILPLALDHLGGRVMPDVEIGERGMAARLLEAARGSAGSPADWEIGAVDQILIACAEHELNASTFAARVVASTGADLYASVLAALCSLSGPIHGGACDRIERMFSDFAGGLRIDDQLNLFGRERVLPPGFGHAIYPDGDPRASMLKKLAESIAHLKSSRVLELALKIEEAVQKRDHLRPNLDFYLTVCARMLDFPLGLPSAIFALARSAGWIAHGLEQYADNRLIRPRMRYRGAPMRHWN